jgi:hypothetical protein
MLRTYKAHSILSFTIVFNGKQRPIQFIPMGGSGERGSYFVTTDKELITALEHDSLFGNMFFKDEERCEDDVYAKDVSSMEELIDEAASESASDNEESKEFVDVEDITNLPDAQKYLVDKGVALRYIRSKAQVMKKAEQLGIRFPNLPK